MCQFEAIEKNEKEKARKSQIDRNVVAAKKRTFLHIA